MSGWFTSFFNGRICRDGELVEGEQLVVSDDTGRILPRTGYIGGDAVDLEDAIIAPGFLDLHTNGYRGFHFTQFDDEPSYAAKLQEVASYLPSQGVTGFWATIPTVSADEFQKILPHLGPRQHKDGAALLGSHAEGPFLNPLKKGAHNSALFHDPSTGPVKVYGSVSDSNDLLKLVTLAPELPDSSALIRNLSSKGIRVSLGHSAASLNDGIHGVKSGATCLTHTLNAMAPLHHRDPGLAGLITTPSASAFTQPYYTIIPDGDHLHSSVATMLFRANPNKCIFVTDSIELAGLPDGTYPGHAQIPHTQSKQGSRVVIEGTDTLIGGCASLQECVQNMVRWSGCNVAGAVRCVTENVADFMGDDSRGKLEAGRCADLVIMDDEANVLETWIGGRQVWKRS